MKNLDYRELLYFHRSFAIPVWLRRAWIRAGHCDPIINAEQEEKRREIYSTRAFLFGVISSALWGVTVAILGYFAQFWFFGVEDKTAGQIFLTTMLTGVSTGAGVYAWIWSWNRPRSEPSRSTLGFLELVKILRWQIFLTGCHGEAEVIKLGHEKLVSLASDILRFRQNGGHHQAESVEDDSFRPLCRSLNVLGLAVYPGYDDYFAEAGKKLAEEKAQTGEVTRVVSDETRDERPDDPVSPLP